MGGARRSGSLSSVEDAAVHVGRPRERVTISICHREFHMSILAPCGSRWLLELSEKLFDWTQRYQNLALRSDVVGSRDVASEHNELVKAILARDVAKSISLLNEHVRTTGRFARAAGEKASVEVT